MPERTLNHFSVFTMSDAYWSLSAADRAALHEDLLGRLGKAATRLDVYQVYPARADADFLVWCATAADNPQSTAEFLEGFAEATNPHRQFVKPALTLWGYTRPSVYGSGSSAQEIDPFAESRQTYLILYPFGKTPEWYLKSRDVRQGMMNEHIRIGRQYPEIKQLLLYSYGLQDQEFVVVYESEDLVRFSDLVAQLRASEARIYTAVDTPTFTAVHRPLDRALALWG